MTIVCQAAMAIERLVGYARYNHLSPASPVSSILDRHHTYPWTSKRPYCQKGFLAT